MALLQGEMTKRLVAQHIGLGSIIAVWLLLPERTWSIKKGSKAMPIFAQAALLLVLLLALPAAATAQNTATFEAPNGSYTFEYSQDFALDQLFADGGSDVTGVTASSPANGDVIITFLGPRDPGEIKEVSEKTHQPIVDEFTNAIARLPSIKLQSSSMTTMLGQPAIDMIFLNKRFVYQGKGNPAVNRYVFTILTGKAYNFECIYREDKTEQFAPPVTLPSRQCGYRMQQRLQALPFRSTTVMMAIDERTGQNPSERGCKDVDAIVETLK